jgi:hypothetical protein
MPQTTSGIAEPHIPGCPCNEDDAAVWIVSVVVAAPVPLGVTVAGEKLTARLKPPVGVMDT